MLDHVPLLYSTLCKALEYHTTNCTELVILRCKFLTLSLTLSSNLISYGVPFQVPSKHIYCFTVEELPLRQYLSKWTWQEEQRKGGREKFIR